MGVQAHARAHLSLVAWRVGWSAARAALAPVDQPSAQERLAHLHPAPAMARGCTTSRYSHLHTRQPARPGQSESGAGGLRPSEPPRQLARATQAGGRTSDQPASACLPSDQIEAQAARGCCSDWPAETSYGTGSSMIGCTIRTLRNVQTRISCRLARREQQKAPRAPSWARSTADDCKS